MTLAVQQRVQEKRRQRLLRGTNGPDVICGLGGNDTIDGLGGDDIIFGDVGDDAISDGAGGDRIKGGSGKDRAYGESGSDFLDMLDGVRANDLGDGGLGLDDCAADQGDRRVSLV